MEHCARRLTYVTTFALVASLLLAPSLVMLPMAGASSSANIQIVYDENPSNWIYVSAPVPASSTLACVQPVTITVNPTGDFAPLVGAATGPGACTTTSPCGPYASASPVVTCTPTTIGGVGPVFVETFGLGSDQVILGCLKPIKVLVDLDGDGNPEIGIDHLRAFDPTCQG